MQTKHTPGPWHIADFADEATTAIITADGDGRIADVGGNELDPQVIAADARLIAASPDLLAALEDCLAWEAYMGGFVSPCFDHARAALAKARGEVAP